MKHYGFRRRQRLGGRVARALSLAIPIIAAALLLAEAPAGLAAGGRTAALSVLVLEPRQPGAVTRADAPQSKISEEVSGAVAVTRLRQAFVNSTETASRGVYVIPLPAEATLQAFEVQVGGETVEAERLTSEQARALYLEAVDQDAIDRLGDADGLFFYGAAAGALAPGQFLAVELRYSVPLEKDEDG